MQRKATGRESGRRKTKSDGEREGIAFIAAAAHQLRTPLTTMSLFGEMLLSERVGKLNAKQREYVLQLYYSSRRLNRLVNTFLHASRADAGVLILNPRLVQLADLIQGAVDELKPVADEEGCKVVFRKPKRRIPNAEVDYALLQQAIQNLVTNAIRYSLPSQCVVTVTLKEEGREAAPKGRASPRVARRGDGSEHRAKISVRDEGIGISVKDQSRIFEKFFRAKNARKLDPRGTGIGLYLVQEIVKISGGRIWFESKEGKGTTFSFTIPLTDALGETGTVEPEGG